LRGGGGPLGRAGSRWWGEHLRFSKKKIWEKKMDFETLPVGTEKLLDALGFELDRSRQRWVHREVEVARPPCCCCAAVGKNENFEPAAIRPPHIGD
jgi:hypothetical protein